MNRMTGRNFLQVILVCPFSEELQELHSQGLSSLVLVISKDIENTTYEFVSFLWRIFDQLCRYIVCYRSSVGLL